jgi:membrane fusion protein, copper/silver efflux system
MSEPETEPRTEMDQPPKGPPPGVRSMSVVRWLLIVLMAGAALASILHFTGAFEPGSSGQGATTEYYCPMHPSVVQDHPGECPICSMTLVPKAKGVAAAPADAGPMAAPVKGLHPIDLTPARTQLVGLRTRPVRREALVQEIRTVGSIVEREDGLGQIQTRFAGWIQELFVTHTGQTVKKGEVLATIYSPEVLAAEQEYVTALRWSAETTPGANLAEDARQRLLLLGISKPELDEIARTKTPVRAIKVRSPLSGTVTLRSAVPGLYVQPGQEIFEVADLSRLWVVADVYEVEIARLRIGLPARLELASFPGETFAGKLTFLSPGMDTATRTLRVRLEVDNHDGRLRPGMYGDVAISLDPAEGLVIPREAAVDTGTTQYVFVARENGRFEPRRVTLGLRAADKVQVLEGLAEGELVVTSGNFLVDSESRLRATIEGEGAPGSPSPASACDSEIDARKYPEKAAQCRQCEVVHRGMGTMEKDCKDAIPRPWK